MLIKKAFVKTKNIEYEAICNMLLLLCIIEASFMLIRCFFGIEITDEAHYIAEAKSILDGNMPIALNNYSYSTCSSFMLAGLLFIYRLFFPELQGVFLFSRICYVVYWLLIIYYIKKVMCKYFDKEISLAFSSILIPYVAGPGIINFSYNTIPASLAILVSFILFDALYNHNRIKILISGLLMSIVCLAHPAFGIAAIICMIFIFMQKKHLKNRIIDELFFLSGAIIVVFITICIIVSSTNMNTFINGLMGYIVPLELNIASYMHANDSIGFKKVLSFSLSFIPTITLGFISYFFTCFVSKKYIFSKQNIDRNKVIEFGLLISCIVLCIYEMTQMIGIDYACYRFGIVGVIGFVIIICNGKYKEYPIVKYVGWYSIFIPLGLIYLIELMPVTKRFTFSLPLFAIVLSVLACTKYVFIKKAYLGLMAICGIMLLVSNYSYIYRDDNIFNLNVRIESGIYKGLYTTHENAEDLQIVEKKINEYIVNEEYAAFDLVPELYIMIHNGKACTRTTWCDLHYSGDGTKCNPFYTYLYYIRRESVPEKIVFLSSGNNLSVDDSDNLYNRFINNFYVEIENCKITERFSSLRVYALKNVTFKEIEEWINTEKKIYLK